MQANEVLKLVTNIGKPLIDQLLIYNSLENSQFKMKLKKSFTKEKIQALFDEENYYDPSCEVQDESLLISAKALKQKLLFGEASKGLYIISVIEDKEVRIPFEVRQKIPLSNLKEKQLNFTNDNEYVIICQRGISSYIATQQLKEKYPNLNILSLKGGITSY
jgi:adenylyltransferase/sulfurtransferase